MVAQRTTGSTDRFRKIPLVVAASQIDTNRWPRHPIGLTTGGGLPGLVTFTLPKMAAPAPRGDPFDALGDPNRRAIVELLRSGSRSVREIADTLPISRPAVSRHLRLLKSAGLVIDRPLGTRRVYELHEQGVEAVQRYLVEVWGDVGARFRLAAENTTPESL
jgi:DNA-binding transcriptional ArsR family regulator